MICAAASRTCWFLAGMYFHSMGAWTFVALTVGAMVLEALSYEGD